MTLEWLLIVGAIAGLAAGSVLAVQRVVDNSTDRPPRPEVRIIDAEIAAAEVAYEATQIVKDGKTYDDNEFKTRCVAVASRFSDVVNQPPQWTKPEPESLGPPVKPLETAKCSLARLEPPP